MNLKKGSRSPVLFARIGALFFALFFLPFLIVGGFLMYQEGIRPYLKAKEALSAWARVPAVVTKSEVESKKDSDGTTYRVDIDFRYEYAGAFYEGGSHDFSEIYSSGKREKVELSEKFPVGKETYCYVNPVEPENAVLLPDGAQLNGFIIFFSGIFAVVGLGGSSAGLYFLVRPKVAVPKVKRSENPFVAEADPQVRGRGALQLIDGRLAGFVSILMVASFWNSITGVFVVLTIGQWLDGSGSWVVTLFLVPFVGIGLLLGWAAVYQLLRVFTPKPRLFLSICPLRSGEIAQLEWSFKEGSNQLKNLKLTLLCREDVTTGGGSDSSTDKEVVYEEVLLNTSDKTQLWTGTVPLKLPESAVPNFESKHNKIRWIVQVEGKVSGLPNVSDEYILPVAIHSYEQSQRGGRA